MAKVLVNETSLNSIAAAIREKNGETTKYKPSEMAAAITALVIGGGGSGGDGVPNPITFTGAQLNSTFKDAKWDWVINNYGDRIQTSNISSGQDTFSSTKVENIPFDINFDKTMNGIPVGNMFNNANNLKSMTGKINGLSLYTARYMFYYCYNLRELPEFINTTRASNESANAFGEMFSNCYSLRRIEPNLLKMLYSTKATNSNGTVYSGLYNLYTIDELTEIPTETATLTSNVFGTAFQRCYRLKKIAFTTKSDGTPKTAKWSNQTIALYEGVGWLTGSDNDIVGYNSGITIDKKAIDVYGYTALKNDPDMYTNSSYFSRFNHDSAVTLINSLPDVTSGSSNTVYFRNDSGVMTDGGSCGSLTEAEIAVATAKGWTIAYKT